MNVKISSGNLKLGKIQSISLPSGITCRSDCECSKKCYAKRIERLRPIVYASYIQNYKVLQNDKDTYWREVEASIMMSRFFRFHVSGDIPDADYFAHMVEIAKRNPHCEILCFTKKYSIVNNYMNNHMDIPQNLHIIFSIWRGLVSNNPYLLPEAHVKYKDGSTTAKEDAKPCGGNCSECAMNIGGCWSLRKGQQVVFNEH